MICSFSPTPPGFLRSSASSFVDLMTLAIAFQSSTRIIGFYKAYFTLLRYRLAGDNHVRLDHRTSPRSHPEGDVGRCLNAIAKRDRLAFRVLLCTAPSSKSEDLLQLADIFCGAVGWAWNGMDSICGAKPILHERICKHLKWAGGRKVERLVVSAEARK